MNWSWDEVPSGLTEDQAVEWITNDIKNQTGYEPPEAEVRAAYLIFHGPDR